MTLVEYKTKHREGVNLNDLFIVREIKSEPLRTTFFLEYKDDVDAKHLMDGKELVSCQVLIDRAIMNINVLALKNLKLGHVLRNGLHD